ncbi:hypothetical protein [Methanobrevibacter sp.]|uniref:hypothetical protein n=1 Tax=Methanobrevibacter sp. TaxID=66852 RepID=UPI0025DB1707|nr:hypothetical protein [Methanobrevibacter sp.]MBQ2832604.1 hypothetical protein [Methanobrevibacter sp.]
MRKEDMVRGFIIAVFIIFIALNINGINSFLSFHTDKTAEFGHSITVVPQAWNTTDELNLTNMSKTPHAITNEYVYIDHWDDWPEDHITSISEAKFRSMEDGGYKVLKNENTTLCGFAVSKQYFSNPSRDTDDNWDHIGVNYVFSKEDTNYAIQVHYFTSQDYNNTTFIKEIDDRIEDDMSNIHNNEFNGFVSAIWHVVDIITSNFS